MPPVFGPVSPSPIRLKSWAGARATARCAVADGEHRELGPGQALLDDDGAPGVAERGAGQLGPDVVLGLVERLGDEHALARGQPVGLHHVGRRQRAQERERRRRRLGEGAVARRWARRPSASTSFIHAFEPSSRAPSAPGPNTSRPAARSRSASPSTSGASGPMTNRSASMLLGRRVDRPRDAGVARGDHDLGGAAQHVGQGVLPSAGADDADPHDQVADLPSTWTYWSRPGADADEADRHADLLLEEADVVPGRRRAAPRPRWPR